MGDWAERVVVEAHRKPQLHVVVADVAALPPRPISHVDQHMVPWLIATSPKAVDAHLCTPPVVHSAGMISAADDHTAVAEAAMVDAPPRRVAYIEAVELTSRQARYEEAVRIEAPSYL